MSSRGNIAARKRVNAHLRLEGSEIFASQLINPNRRAADRTIDNNLDQYHESHRFDADLRQLEKHGGRLPHLVENHIDIWTLIQRLMPPKRPARHMAKHRRAA